MIFKRIVVRFITFAVFNKVSTRRVFECLHKIITGTCSIIKNNRLSVAKAVEAVINRCFVWVINGFPLLNKNKFHLLIMPQAI